MPGIFPDYAAPIVRNRADVTELTLARGACLRLSIRHADHTAGRDKLVADGIIQIHECGGFIMWKTVTSCVESPPETARLAE
jgi:hypothetical protein